MGEQLLLIVLIINMVISLAVFLFLFQRNKKLAFICFFLAFLLPVVGIFLCLIMFIRFDKSHYEMAAGETIRKYKIKEVEYIDDERLQNTVPVNDALSLSNEKERRSFLLGLLRQKEMASLRDTLKKALSNEDSEASHYAASALMELQRESYSAMVDQEKLYRTETPLTYDTAIKYAVSVMNYLENSEVGQLESYTFRMRYEEVMKTILSRFREACMPEDYENYIDMLIRQGRLEEAKDISGQYLESYSQNERSYIYGIKVCYHQSDRNGLEEMLRKIRNSTIILSPDSLSVLRFWINA